MTFGPSSSRGNETNVVARKWSFTLLAFVILLHINLFTGLLQPTSPGWEARSLGTPCHRASYGTVTSKSIIGVKPKIPVQSVATTKTDRVFYFSISSDEKWWYCSAIH